MSNQDTEDHGAIAYESDEAEERTDSQQDIVLDYEEQTMSREVIDMYCNDISRVPQVRLAKQEIEEIHFETTYQKNRLNEEIDIHNIDMRHLMNLVEENEANYKPVTAATIRALAATAIDIRIQIDGGANRSITQHKHILHDVRKISPVVVDGIGGEIMATAVVYLKLTCDDDRFLKVKTFYCPDSPETIVSPTDVALSQNNLFTTWTQYSDVLQGEGYLRFATSSGLDRATVPLFMKNGLWFTHQFVRDMAIWNSVDTTPIVRNINLRAEYELWHQRLGHSGDNVMAALHKCVDGVHQLKPHKHPFRKCECCIKGKITAAPKNKTTSRTTTARGQLFHMDFGFVRGTKFKEKDVKGRIVTSRDGYNSYLIVVDVHTRYSWVFLSATKEPPLHIVKTFLQRFGIKEGTYRQIRCDQGNELARSSKFREVVQNEGYSIEPTGTDNSSQNGVAERPNRTFGNMMRTMLINAGLGPEFWSYALVQAVFVENRLSHNHHDYKKTPFEALSGRRPKIKNLKNFGSRVIAKLPGERRAKLDDHTSSGVFLHHTSTTNISKYLDDKTNREKVTSHLTYDEAHDTTTKKPLGAMILEHAGHSSPHDDTIGSEEVI